MHKCTLRRLISRLLAILMMAALTLQIGLTDHTYAKTSDTDAGNKAASETSEDADEDEDAPYVMTAAELTEETGIIISTPELSMSDAIEVYGYFEGKNATRIPVITYHRVVSDKQKRKIRSGLYISQSSFRKQMKWLRSHKYRTINCQEFYLWYKGKISLPKKSVLITFDDSRESISKYAYPVLKKYDLKATVFTIGHGVRNSDEESIKLDDVPDLLEKYPNIEYQSHTYALHHHFGEKGDYKVVKKDAKKQSKYFDFQCIAYPFGRNTAGMRKAYKEAGMKLGFTYGQSAYATKKQSRFQIRRIRIDGNGSFDQFRRWFR